MSITEPDTHSTERDATPRLTPHYEWAVRIFAILTIAYSTYYIAWRWVATIHWEAWWFSVPLALAESYILLAGGMLLFTAWEPKRRTPPPAPEGLDVDVYITTYDEPLEIIRRTALGALAIRYPHKTWILDDGKRDAVRDLADELGAGYIRREGNEHAKAGNLNNALGVTEGEFILQLDADHVPLPKILDRLLGFFRDPEVAFVQSPQDFYNTDSFSYDVNEEAHRLWEEQRIFFSLIQPGKDRWNAAFFCGSCGVLRRQAFESIGGFRTETITEDMETSLVLHARGWKSVYYAESLAYGLAPASASQYAVQRLRWGQGSMQVLRKYRPLRYPGLTIPQRIAYFNSTIAYLDGPLKLILYSAPVVFFLTGVLPIHVNEREFLARFIPYLVLNLAMFAALFRGTGFLLLSERYNMAKFWIYTRAISGYFARGHLKFNVTPKSQGDVPFRIYAPQLFLAIITVVSLVWATLAYTRGWIDYEAPGWGSLAFWFNAAWAIYNLTFALYVVRLSLQYKQQRYDERFRAMLPLRIRRLDDEDDGDTGWFRGLSTDLNPDGLGFRSTRRLPVGARLRFELPLGTGPITATGEILHRDPRRVGDIRLQFYGVELDDLPPEDRDAIDLHCTHHEVPAQRFSYRETRTPIAVMTRWLHDPRIGPRRQVNLAALIYRDGNGPAGGESEPGYLADASRTGARLVVEDPVPPGTPIRFEVPGSTIARHGTVASLRIVTTPVGTVYVVGVNTTATNGAAGTGSAGGPDRRRVRRRGTNSQKGRAEKC